MNTTSTAPAIPQDFPDWLSPIIVKEVRQGLRSKVFLLVFIALHLLMMTWAAITVIAASSEARATDVIFWSILIIGLIVLGLRGQSSIRNERRGNTLELLQITQQSAWRIAAGKWSALMVQTLLFIVSLMPYAALRYFSGVVNIISDAAFFFSLVFISSAIAAFTIFISCYGVWLGLLVNALSFVLICAIVIILSEFSGARGTLLPFSLADPQFLPIVPLIIFGYALLYTLVFIAMAAGEIASASDNLATRKRLFGILLLLFALVPSFFAIGSTLRWTLLFATAPVVVILINAVITTTSPAIPVFESFGKYRLLGRLAALFFSPSQGAGILYVTLMFGAFAIIPLINTNANFEDFITYSISWLNILLMPFVLARLSKRFFPRLRFFPRYWFCAALMAQWGVTPKVISHIVNIGEFQYLACISPVGMVFHKPAQPHLTGGFLILTSAFVLVFLVPFVLRDLRAVWKMTYGERSELPLV